MDGQTITEVAHISIGTGLSILGLAFGAWAYVVYWGVTVIRNEVSELKEDVKTAAEKSHTRDVHLENRIAHLETLASFCKNGER